MRFWARSAKDIGAIEVLLIDWLIDLHLGSAKELSSLDIIVAEPWLSGHASVTSIFIYPVVCHRQRSDLIPQDVWQAALLYWQTNGCSLSSNTYSNNSKIIASKSQCESVRWGFHQSWILRYYQTRKRMSLLSQNVIDLGFMLSSVPWNPWVTYHSSNKSTEGGLSSVNYSDPFLYVLVWKVDAVSYMYCCRCIFFSWQRWTI